MPLKRKFYDVYLNVLDDDGEPTGEHTEHRVAVTIGDKMRAEFEGARHSITLETSFNFTVVCTWAALVREGIVRSDFQTYKQILLLDLSNAEDGGSTTVDPTQAGPSASPSSSLSTLAGDPVIGSTPPSTSD